MGGTGVSRDDLLLDEGEVSLYVGKKARPVMVQEKVDGANLGISISIDMKVTPSSLSSQTHLCASDSLRLSVYALMHHCLGAIV